jgi:hypothetical protein
MNNHTILKSAKSLLFEHNRNDVNVHVFNEKNERLLTINNVNADLFLNYFSYGETICDNANTCIDFLKEL